MAKVLPGLLRKLLLCTSLLHNVLHVGNITRRIRPPGKVGLLAGNPSSYLHHHKQECCDVKLAFVPLFYMPWGATNVKGGGERGRMDCVWLLCGFVEFMVFGLLYKYFVHLILGLVFVWICAYLYMHLLVCAYKLLTSAWSVTNVTWPTNCLWLIR